MSESHPLDRALEFEVVDDDVVRGQTQPEWANMVGPFGGVTAAASCTRSMFIPTALVSPSPSRSTSPRPSPTALSTSPDGLRVPIGRINTGSSNSARTAR